MASRSFARTPSDMGLPEQFMAHAESVFLFSSLFLPPESKELLGKDFSSAAGRMNEENRLSASDIGYAHHAVGIYAQAIVMGTRASQNPGPANVIQPNIIYKVKNFLCPGFWPFC
jgi:hypothetical protein